MILLVIALATNLLAQWIVRRFERRSTAGHVMIARARPDGAARRGRATCAGAAREPADGAAPRPRPRCSPVAVLAIVVVVRRRARRRRAQPRTSSPTPRRVRPPGGGIAPAIVGTALHRRRSRRLIALPVGILVALYLTEFAGPRLARAIRLALDVLNGLPSIVIGIFVFGLLVIGAPPESGFAGAVALAIIMLPLIARVEPGGAAARAAPSCARRPRARREPLAHGARRHPAERRSAASSPARSSPSPARPGETAPLLFTSSIFSPRNVAGPLRRRRCRTSPCMIFFPVRVGRPGRPRARVGRGARAARLHPVANSRARARWRAARRS